MARKPFQRRDETLIFFLRTARAFLFFFIGYVNSLLLNIVFVRLYTYEDIILLFLSFSPTHEERSVTILYYYKDLPIIISSRCICAHVFGRPVFFSSHTYTYTHIYVHARIQS